MNSNFRLPTAGEANWGAALNAYLENLNFRLGTLETKTSTSEGATSIQNIGTASSGLIGECNVSMTGDKVTFSLKTGASVFISGAINTSFSSIGTITSNTINSNTPVFVYLHYTSIPDKLFEILSSKTFNLTYLDILIGFAWKGEFISYYGSSLKTISQHYYEIQHRWVDTNSTSSGFDFDLIVNSNSCTFNPSGSVLMYCGNTGGTADEKNYYSPIVPYTVNIKNDSLRVIKDYKDGNGILKSNALTTTWSTTKADSYGRRFRILLTIFGHCIIQEAAIDSVNYSFLTSSDQLHNTKFNNDFGYDASLWVELYRFGFINDKTIEIDTTDSSFNNTGGFVVQTLNQDVVWQQGKKSWLMDSSTINLNNTVFTTGSDVNNKAMKLAYSYPAHQERQYFKLDGSLPQGFGTEDTNPFLILTNVNKLPNDYYLDISLESKDKYSCSGLYIDKDIVSLGLYDDRIIPESIQTAGLSIAKDGTTTLDSRNKYNKNSYIQLSPVDIVLACNSSAHSDQGCIVLAADRNVVLMGGDSVVLESERALSISSNENILLDSQVTINGDTIIKESCGIYLTSDRRRKEKFSAIDASYLDVVKATPVLNYYYKNSDKQQVGIIAQDLENALSTNIDVFVNKQDTVELKNQRSLSETKLVYILWKALQEETELRNKLEQRVAELEQNF